MLLFRHLQEALRTLLSEQIDAGELTGSALAEQTGFRQAHISNFLNRKRALSLHGMDRVLLALGLSALDLVPPQEIAERATLPLPRDSEFADLPVVDRAHAADPHPQAKDVDEVVKFREAWLRKMRPNLVGERQAWLRFVMLRPSRADCEAMAPLLAPNSLVLIDRHYNALVPYRRGDRPMFAVQHNGGTSLRFVDDKTDQLILRVRSHKAEAELLPVAGDTHQPIIGRVAYVWTEL